MTTHSSSFITIILLIILVVLIARCWICLLRHSSSSKILSIRTMGIYGQILDSILRKYRCKLFSSLWTYKLLNLISKQLLLIKFYVMNLCRQRIVQCLSRHIIITTIIILSKMILRHLLRCRSTITFTIKIACAIRFSSHLCRS